MDTIDYVLVHGAVVHGHYRLCTSTWSCSRMDTIDYVLVHGAVVAWTLSTMY